MLFRMPAIDRPVSKHFEFNTAVVLINAISWNQAGGGGHFNFTPLMNFQGDANKLLEQGPFLDKEHNHVYVSSGAGWYVLPYLFFNTFNLPPTALWLRILSIFAGLLSFVLLSRLFIQSGMLPGPAHRLSFLFCIMPAPLWYMGIAYVTVGIMMPFVLWILLLWNERSTALSEPTAGWYAQLFAAGVLLIFFEWYGVFLLAAIFWWAMLTKMKKQTRLKIAATAFLAGFTGVMVIFLHFASYVGFDQVADYWISRFSSRGFAGINSQHVGHTLQQILQHLLTAFLPLFLLLAWIFLKGKAKSHKPRWPIFLLVFTGIYNMAFLDWSVVHEFAWMAFGLSTFLFVFLRYDTNLINHRNRWIFVTLCVFSLAIYFTINLPGNKSLKGLPYTVYAEAGKKISANIPDAAFIFSSRTNEKIIEWNARRTINKAKDIQTAKRIMDSLQLKEGFFLDLGPEGDPLRFEIKKIPRND